MTRVKENVEQSVCQKLSNMVDLNLVICQASYRGLKLSRPSSIENHVLKTTSIGLNRGLLILRFPSWF